MNYKTRQPFPHAAYVEGQRNFTYFDRSLTSGLADVVIESPGDFLYIDQASTGVVSVELNMRQGGTLAPILLAAGGSIECDFASIKLNATAQLNKTVRIIVGNGARIKGGANVNASSMSVSVVDGGLIRTIAKKANFGVASADAVAAQYPLTQLWNPAASGKNLYLETVNISSTTAQVFQLATTTAQLANVSTSISNKYIGQAVGVGILAISNNAVVPGVVYGPAYYAAANSPVDIKFTEPVLIPPGYGVMAFGIAANSTLVMNAEWYEE